MHTGTYNNRRVKQKFKVFSFVRGASNRVKRACVGEKTHEVGRGEATRYPGLYAHCDVDYAPWGAPPWTEPASTRPRRDKRKETAREEQERKEKLTEPKQYDKHATNAAEARAARHERGPVRTYRGCCIVRLLSARFGR